MSSAPSEIIQANISQLPPYARTVAGALLAGLRIGAAGSNRDLPGKFPKLLHQSTFKPMMYSKLPKSDWHMLPNDLVELLMDGKFMQGDFVRLVPRAVQRAHLVLAGVKKRGQAQGDRMDQVTEQALLPGILREAFAMELEIALAASLEGTLSLRRVLSTPLAHSVAPEQLEQLTEEAMNLAKDVSREVLRIDTVCIPEFLGSAKWQDLVRADAVRLFEAELGLSRVDLATAEANPGVKQVPGPSKSLKYGLTAQKATNNGALVARCYLPAEPRAETAAALPALCSVLERMRALGGEMNEDEEEDSHQIGEDAGAKHPLQVPGGATDASIESTIKSPPQAAAASGGSPSASDPVSGSGYMQLLNNAVSLFAVQAPPMEAIENMVQPPRIATGSSATTASTERQTAGTVGNAGESSSSPSAAAAATNSQVSPHRFVRVLKLGTPPEYRGMAMLGVSQVGFIYAATPMRLMLRRISAAATASEQPAGASMGKSAEKVTTKLRTEFIDMESDSMLMYNPECISVVAAARIGDDDIMVGLSCSYFVKPNPDKLAAIVAALTRGKAVS